METFLLDTSFLGARDKVRVGRASEPPSWRQHLERIDAGVPAITPFTLAELKAGWQIAGWGQSRRGEAERRAASYLLIPLDPSAVDEWARLRAQTRASGHDGLPHNDLWNAAIASARGVPLVAIDNDFHAVAPHMDCEVVLLEPPGPPPAHAADPP